MNDASINKFEASEPKGIPVKRDTEQQSPQNLQVTLTVKMTAAQVVETSVTVNNKFPIQDYVHPGDHAQPTYEMTPGFKPFIITFLSTTLLLSKRLIQKQEKLCESSPSFLSGSLPRQRARPV